MWVNVRSLAEDATTPCYTCCRRAPWLLTSAASNTITHTSKIGLARLTSSWLRAEAERAGLTLLGPHSAFLVQGDDGVGVLAGILEKLYASNVNVYASSAVAAGKGNFGYILYVWQEKYETAAEALGV